MQHAASAHQPFIHLGIRSTEGVPVLVFRFVSPNSGPKAQVMLAIQTRQRAASQGILKEGGRKYNNRGTTFTEFM